MTRLNKLVPLAAWVSSVLALGPEPVFPSDPSTSPYCSWWLDVEAGNSCETILSENWITIEEFFRWNPTVKDDCSGLQSGRAYCVEAWGEPPVASEPTTTTTIPVNTPTTLTTSTRPPVTTTTTEIGNGIATPVPTQSGMVKNCAKFYHVSSGDSCAAIAQQHGISTTEFATWNPSVGTDCTGLWANVHVCVATIGYVPAPVTTTRPATTTTTAGNGIATPTPIQQGMVSNCNKFYYVPSGSSCAIIAQQHGISQAQFSSWNPSVGTDCAGLWAEVHVCVSVVGFAPAPTTTTRPATTTTPAGNGIATPSPIQPNMVTNCNKFYLVKTGDSCATIASRHSITTANFSAWNRNVGSNCAGLWAEAWACVSVIGFTPAPTTTTTRPATTTTRGNGITTPTPIQTGMVTNCKTFHLVKSGQTCATIASQYKITVANFTRWNPAVGSNCAGMWANTHACVGV